MNTFYLLLGGLFAIYIVLSALQKKRSKARRSRNFMDGQHIKDRKDPDSGN